MKKKLIKQLIGIFTLSTLMFSCENVMHFNMPEGPEGPDGKSAYEIWVENVENGTIDWSKDRVTIEQFFLYLKGKDGKDGQDGKDGVDGLSAYELWIKEVEKGIQDPHNPGKEWDKSKTEVNDFWYFLTGADGKDGKNGSTPVIGDNGNWWIDGIDTGKPSKGADGKGGSLIEISNNNTWIIDGTDTGVPVHGKDGQDGKNGSVVTIGDNGNWHIDGIDTTVPAQGKDGVNGSDGTNGNNGLSAYKLWVTEVMKGIEDPHNPGNNWDKSKISMDDFWYYLRGKTGVDGQNGQDGKDGSIVTIGDNGNWHIDGIDTTVPAQGKDGQDGKGDRVTIGENDNWYINGIDTGIPVKGNDGEDGKDGQDGQPGRDGSVVTIGDNGNWFIDGEDTNEPAFGKDGQDGQDGQDGASGLSAYELWKKEVATGKLDDPKNPALKWPTDKDSVQDFWEYLTGKNGNDGNNGNDGQDGQDGKNGQSAYELWKEEVAKGLENPHKPGTDWPKDQITIQDFWEFLRGKDGKDGQDGEDGKPGEPGKPGETIPVIVGQFNVISQYVDQDHAEFVRWKDGSVTFIVYDKLGAKAPGAKVSGLPGVANQSQVYTADANGEIVITKDQLPKDGAQFGSTATVSYKGETEASAPNTFVPAKIDVRVLIDETNVPSLNQNLNITLIVERRLSTKHQWQQIPNYLGELEQKFKAYDPSDPNYNGKGESTGDISEKPTLKLLRPLLDNKYIKDKSRVWDNKDHILEIKLESYYGESPVCDQKIKVPPIQSIPIVGNLKRGDIEHDSSGNKSMQYLDGVFDINDIDINYSLMFMKKLVLKNNIYEPVIEDKNIVNAEQCLGIKFSILLPGSKNILENHNNYRASINNPKFSFTLLYIGSMVDLIVKPESQYFASYWDIGNLEEDQIKGKQWTNYPNIPISK